MGRETADGGGSRLGRRVFLGWLLAGGGAGCSFIEDSKLEPYRVRHYYTREGEGDAEVLVGDVRVEFRLLPKQNHTYGTEGPYSPVVDFSSKADGVRVGVERVELTGRGGVREARGFSGLRERIVAARREPVTSGDGVRVFRPAGEVIFSFRELIEIPDERAWNDVVGRVVVVVVRGGTERREALEFRFKAKTERGVWQWYPPT